MDSAAEHALPGTPCLANSVFAHPPPYDTGDWRSGIILADNGMSGGLIGTPDARWNDTRYGALFFYIIVIIVLYYLLWVWIECINYHNTATLGWTTRGVVRVNLFCNIINIIALHYLLWVWVWVYKLSPHSLQMLRAIKLSEFEPVDVSSLIVDNDSGQVCLFVCLFTWIDLTWLDLTWLGLIESIHRLDACSLL